MDNPETHATIYKTLFTEYYESRNANPLQNSCAPEV